MKYIIMVLVILIVAVGCTRPDKTKQVLEAQGYSNIRITGYAFWSCGKEDSFSTGFTGEINGKTVSGVACEGVLKGVTLRFD